MESTRGNEGKETTFFFLVDQIGERRTLGIGLRVGKHLDEANTDAVDAAFVISSVL